MIARGRYIRGGAANRASATSHLNAHLKYLEHRSRDEQESREDRSIFSKDADQDDQQGNDQFFLNEYGSEEVRN